MGTIFIFVLILVILILVHEIGHFVAAKKAGIRVDEFGIGFPPKIFGKKIGETEYTLNWIPLGGFVRIWGEDQNTESTPENDPDHKRSFIHKPRYIQAMVLVAGVSMNIFFAFFLYVIAYLIGMPTHISDNVAHDEYRNVQVLITSIIEGSPAAESLKVNDEIRALRTSDNILKTEKGINPKEISEFIASSNGANIIMDVIRRNEPLSITLTPQQGVLKENPTTYATGFSMSHVGIRNVTPIEAVTEASMRTVSSFVAITKGLFDLLGGIFNGTSDLSQVSGPVGIVGLVGDAAALGIIWLLSFSAFISLNLAVINLFPFPALDGGRLLFVAIEGIIRKPIPQKITTTCNQFGFIVLLLLMLVVTISDVIKLF